MIHIRPASLNDLPALREIINDQILNDTVRWDYEPQSLEQVEKWFRTKLEANRPVIVAEHEGEVCGYGTYDQFRAREGYRFSMEHSVYVAKGKFGLGIGTQIMEWLIQSAKDQGHHSLIAGIDGANDGSMRFHVRFGFVEVARFKEIGFKFDRWLDLVFMQLMLNE